MSVVYNGVNQAPTIVNASGKSQTQLALELNSCRIIAVAEQLSMCVKYPDQNFKIHQLCLSLASGLDDVVEGALQDPIRGLDYGLANNEVPAAASQLPQVLKEVCNRKNDMHLQAAIMVLMISVKNACKLGWFTVKDTEELLKLADEVASYFVTKKDLNTEMCQFLPTVSTIMSRFYPRFKLGKIIASLEVEPGYGTHLIDFHISKDITVLKDERIRLFVAMKDNIDTSSCIITPQQVNILLNGKPVDHRNSVIMDHGPQLPTIVNQALKYGINLLQVMGHFTGHCIFVVALMSVIPSSDLHVPSDYVQPVSAVSSSDSEIIEGPSRVTLNCPISKQRIGTPVKGNLCKHYQCFDFNNYVEINNRRPSWRCPSCNQSVCFTDLRVDQNMVKVLKEVGENVSEVIISVDGTWAAASSDKHKDESHDKTSAIQQGGQELENDGKLNASDNMYDLTGEDEEMDTDEHSEPVDTKPVVHHNTQGQSISSNLTSLPMSRTTTESTQYSPGQGVSSVSPGTVFSSGGFNFRPQAQVGGHSGTLGTLAGNVGVTPVLTDAVSPVLNRQPDNFQETGYSTSPFVQNSAPTPSNVQLREALMSHMNNFQMIPRNVTRVPSAIQALPVQMPTTSAQQHSRPSVSFPAGGNGSSAPLNRPVVGSNAHATSPFSSNAEMQHHLSQMPYSAHMSNLASLSPRNRSAPPGVSHSIPSHNMPMPQTLRQPPHLMRTSQLPRNHIQHGVSSRTGASNSPSTLQRVQLTPQQAPHLRHAQTMPHQAQTARTAPSMPLNSGGTRTQTMPLQTPAARTVPSVPLNSGGTRPQTMPLQTQAARTASLPPNSGGTPQAVSRAENLIDLQVEQNWRPSARMRGALTGKAYSDALNQYMGQAAPPAQTPSSRPTVPPATSLPPNISVLLANRRIASETRDPPAPVSGNVSTQPEGSQGMN